MAIQANAKIVIRGGPESLKTLQGIKRETTGASAAAKKAAQETERWQKLAQKSMDARLKAEQRAAREAVRTADTATKAKLKADREIARSAEKTARDLDRLAQREADRWQKMAQASANERIRQQKRVTEEAKREAAKQAAQATRLNEDRRGMVRRAGGVVGAVAAGALAGGMVAAGTARSISGVKDVRERITSANEFRERLVIATNQAGMSPQDREAAQGKILGASVDTGKDIGELMSVLETGQAQFNNLKFFADNIGEIAKLSKAAGADTGEFATALGYAQQAFGLTGEEAMEAAYLMKASADKGSVELSNFARDFAASAGIFAMNTGQKGLSGVRSYLGTAQGVATGGFGSAESATRMERLVTDLNDVEVQKGLKGIGIKNISDKSGRIDIGSVISQLSGNKKFQNAGTRQGIFKEVRSLQAIEALVAAQQRVQSGKPGAVDYRTIAGVDAKDGRAATEAGFSAMQSEGFFKHQQEAARMQADTVENLETYNAQVLKVTETADRLEKAFGTLSLWANSVAAAGIVGAGTSLVGKLAGGAPSTGGALAKAVPSLAKAGGSMANAGVGALALGSTAVSLGTSAGLALAGGAVLAGGALGYGVGSAINEGTEALTGKSASDRLADIMFQLVHGNEKLIRVTEESNRKLAQLDQTTRTAGAKNGGGASREPR